MRQARYTVPRPEVAMDVECYRNWFQVQFKRVNGSKVVVLEMYEGHPLDRERIVKIFRNNRVYTFNGNNYDMLMVAYAMKGATCAELKTLSDQIIEGRMKPWQVRDRYDLELPGFIDHVDLMEVAPGMASLKIYGGRMHSLRMQELPIEPDAILTRRQMDKLIRYCENDLDTTIDLRNELKEELALREVMSDEYGMDLRSKSDAQVAEAVIRRQVEDQLSRRVYKPDLVPGYTFTYKPPRYLKYRTPLMQQVLETVRTTKFKVGHDGYVQMPKSLKDLKIEIGSGVYRMGIGGLHSSEKCVSYVSDDEYVLIDRDVASYYPALILSTMLAPRQLGPVFLEKYRGHRDARLACKRAGDKVGANSRKIMLNGTFGKLGSPYSIFYSPDLLIQVTLSGQLALLMLIETIELHGMQVVSANTDGLVTRVPRDRIDEFNAIIWDWEVATTFETEETRYTAIYSRDVNNYFALKMKFDKETGQWVDGEVAGVKGKGAYANPTSANERLRKNPTNLICVDAVEAYLTKGVPPHETIRACKDIRRFITVRQVKGGAVRGDKYLGKAIRWYYSTEASGPIQYKMNGNNVPVTEGAMPCMQLPEELPADLDYDWYIREAHGILQRINAPLPPLVLSNPDRRTGYGLARLPDAKNIHTVEWATGMAVCGAALKGIHDKWIEYDAIPAGHRECPKCRKLAGDADDGVDD